MTELVAENSISAYKNTGKSNLLCLRNCSRSGPLLISVSLRITTLRVHPKKEAVFIPLERAALAFHLWFVEGISYETSTTLKKLQ